MIKGKNRSTYNLLRVGILLFLASFVFTGIAFYIRNRGLGKTKDDVKINGSAGNRSEKEPSKILYRSSRFGYIVMYPPNLQPNLIDNQGGFLHFVRFEGKASSTDKGFAVGVSSLSVAEELVRIKESFRADENADLVKEDDVYIKGFTAKRLSYKPKDPKLGEERVVIVFNKDKYTYSLSSHPEVMEQVINDFSLIAINSTPTLAPNN